jgi:hypothetical protein
MQAVCIERFGGPEELSLCERDEQPLAPDGVRVMQGKLVLRPDTP